MNDIYEILGFPNVFRYRKANDYAIDELKNNYLFFPDRTQLNDPFDAHKSLIKVTHDKVELRKIFDVILANLKTTAEAEYFNTTYDDSTIRKFVEDNIEGYIMQFGIACFSMTWFNMPLWANYSLNHTGICLHFDINLDSDFFNGSQPMNYEDNLDVREYSFTKDDQILNLFFRKDAKWMNEEELRLLKHPKGKYKFKRESLKTIFLGYNIDKNYKNKIVAIVKEFYPHSTLYQIQEPKSINKLTLTKI